ncbi:6-bladed beta-propeller [Longimicrobium terrae]|uniref:6-bladed beta-propeller n=1 Tax=Longimicrobium terrae TaxID=1639882 RepID=A0A841GXR3_9BACT|nr:6-bladed beta-propeller [Longimicrobium terrae]MBB4636143.1 hypothetical protein [Longimicrobium terrae]MBB6070538.1 hypothetical protein [Longimicrobium terrae]NNC29524.1 6-bladed beta-propeller [Longimicrobium terrae]
MKPMIRVAASVLSALVLATGARAQARVIPLPARDRPLAGTPAQVFSVGQAEGSDEQMFGVVAGVAFDARDNLYVLDRQSARVMVYGPTGRFIRQIGGKGEGPGEFSHPMQFAVTPDGRVVVHDAVRAGFIVFGPDGAYLRDVPMERLGFGTGAGFAWHPRGGVVGTFRNPASREGNFSRTETSVPLLFQPLAGGAAVRLFRIPEFSRVEQTEQSSGSGSVRNVTRTMMMQGPPVFAPSPSFGVLPGGEMALTFTNGYTIRILSPDGQTARYLQRPMRARVTTEADRERARDRARESMRQLSGSSSGGRSTAPSSASVEEYVSGLTFADTIAAVRALRTTPSGRIWVQRTATADEPGPLDLITARGEYLGTTSAMKLPDAVSASGLAAFIETDEDDVARVVVRRLPAGWR